MNSRPAYTVLTRFGIIAAVLATLVLIAPAAQSASQCALDGGTVKCTYEENGTAPVANFVATDEDGDPSTWSLKEDDDTDYKKFEITSIGVLTFKTPPDFDSPGDKGKDNVYNLTVVADADSGTDGERAVVVTVTDVNETGEVTFTGNQQPQIGRPMTASLSDEDGSTVRLSWQWSKGPDKDDGPWEDVSSTSSSYTPKAEDVGSYLRATVSYTDVEYDERDTASGVTNFTVRVRPAANTAPKVDTQKLEVFENKDGAVGSVTAEDDDELIFRLWATGDTALTSDTDGDNSVDTADNDNARFTVEPNGELKLKDKLDFEQAAPVDNATDLRSDTNIAPTVDTNGDGSITAADDVIIEYTVVVTAEDPSGATGSGVVIVHLLNVDEAPEVTITAGGSGDNNTGDEPTVIEAGTPTPGAVARTGQITAIDFAVGADPEGGTTDADNSRDDNEAGLAWTLEGPDAAKFAFDLAENGNPSSILFKGAASGDDGYFRPNFDDKKDANGDNVYEVTVVVPVKDSVKPGKKTVKVKVTNAEDVGKLEIKERQPQVGASVSGKLSDEDGGVRDREWQWYRGGNDDTSTGDNSEMAAIKDAMTDSTDSGYAATQIACGATGANAPSQTLACKIDKATSPSYTTVTADGGYHVHLVVSYTDAFDSDGVDNSTDTATLTQTTTKAVQAPPTSNAAPKFGIQDREIDGDDAAPESVTRKVKEGNKPVAEFNATDTDLLTFSLGGADGGMFKLSDPSDETNDVSLSFADAPDFEDPGDADGDNSYEVSIEAKDPSGATDTLTVTVVVEDVDDKPSISLVDDGMCSLDGSTVKCTYAEGGTGSVASFSVADDENDPTTWALKEADDYKKFELSADGVLTFKDSPNFDSAGDGDKDNVYKVTVVADGGDRSDGERAVEVTVTDVNETGTVEFTGNQQPQVGEATMAKLTDEDGAVVRLTWKWQKGADKDDGPWEDLSSTSASYTPKAADVGSYLRAEVDYTDVEFDAKDTASGVTKFTVRARPSANAAPKIPAQKLEVFENTKGAIGSVEATDDDEEWIFSLKADAATPLVTTDSDGDNTDDNTDNDNAKFTITDSGELSLTDELDFEQQDSGTNSQTDLTGDDGTSDIVEYTVVVTAEDPSGAKGSGVVIVHLLNVDEAPELTASAATSTDITTALALTGSTYTISVNEEQRAAPVLTFTAGDDPDVGHATNQTVKAGADWTLEGADSGKFKIGETSDGSATADVTFADDFTPSFEDKKDANGDGVYEVTVVAPVNNSVKPGKRAVKVTVDDIEDVGELKIEARQPQVGASVSGSLSDEDGGIKGRAWKWYRGGAAIDLTSSSAVSTLAGIATLCSATAATDSAACLIDKATSPNYTTVTADGKFYIHLVVSYEDAFGTDTATLAARPTRKVQEVLAENAAPKFGVQDREIDGNDDAPESVARKVKEGDKAVGDFNATDTDLLTFSLGGADGGMFKLSGPSDETNVVSLSFADAPDFENPGDAGGDNTYELSITAKDPSGATDTLGVTVMVEDKDEGASISLNDAPTFAAETTERMVDENSAEGAAVGDPVAATDPNDTDVLTYSLDETGDMYFDIDSATGQISVGAGAMLDYESATTSYSATVTVTDMGGLSDTIDVTINVADVNEPPMFAEDSTTREVAESSAAGDPVGDVVTASDVDAADADGLKYSIDGDSFAIDDMGQITVAADAMLDFESDMNSYMVTVTATDSADNTDTIEVTINLTDAQEAPMFADDTAMREVAENSEAGASVGDPVTASDQDAVDMDALMYSIDGDDSFTIGADSGQIMVAEGAMLDYEADVNSYMVTVTATDSAGLTDTIEVTINLTDIPETPAFPANVSYTFTVAENTEAGVNVGSPVVADLPTSVYTLEGDDAGAFDIDSATGQIMTKGALDFESKNTYVVTVKATVRESDTTDVTILVVDTHASCTMEGNVGLTNDCEALMDSMSALGGSLGWTTDTAIGEWDGVMLSGDEGMERVTKLDLRKKGLDGMIPADLGRLSALETLWLKDNDLTGSIPAELGDLSSLSDLILSGNDLSGSIPAELGGLSSLARLWLHENGLSGGIPDLTGTSLTDLRLHSNDLTGGIPASLGNITTLGNLYLRNNANLGGSIPAELNALSNLRILDLHTTGLTGSIPYLGAMTSLRTLNLRDNMLTGDVPDLSGLTSLTTLNLRGNKLSGEIPGTLGDIGNLQRLYLDESFNADKTVKSANQFTSINAGLANAADTLTHLYLGGNAFPDGTCLTGGLADVANNDFDAAGLASCDAPAPTTPTTGNGNGNGGSTGNGNGGTGNGNGGTGNGNGGTGDTTTGNGGTTGNGNGGNGNGNGGNGGS